MSPRTRNRKTSVLTVVGLTMNFFEETRFSGLNNTYATCCFVRSRRGAKRLVAHFEQHQRSSRRRPGVGGGRCFGAAALAQALLRVSMTARTPQKRPRTAIRCFRGRACGVQHAGPSHSGGRGDRRASRQSQHRNFQWPPAGAGGGQAIQRLHSCVRCRWQSQA